MSSIDWSGGVNKHLCPAPPVSRYNKHYSCTIVRIDSNPSTQELTVYYSARGNKSIGTLPHPEESILIDAKGIEHPVLSHTILLSENKSKRYQLMEGRLVFGFVALVQHSSGNPSSASSSSSSLMFPSDILPGLPPMTNFVFGGAIGWSEATVRAVRPTTQQQRGQRRPPVVRSSTACIRAKQRPKLWRKQRPQRPQRPQQRPHTAAHPAKSFRQPARPSSSAGASVTDMMRRRRRTIQRRHAQDQNEQQEIQEQRDHAVGVRGPIWIEEEHHNETSLNRRDLRNNRASTPGKPVLGLAGMGRIVVSAVVFVCFVWGGVPMCFDVCAGCVLLLLVVLTFELFSRFTVSTQNNHKQAPIPTPWLLNDYSDSLLTHSNDAAAALFFENPNTMDDYNQLIEYTSAAMTGTGNIDQYLEGGTNDSTITIDQSTIDQSTIDQSTADQSTADVAPQVPHDNQVWRLINSYANVFVENIIDCSTKAIRMPLLQRSPMQIINLQFKANDGNNGNDGSAGSNAGSSAGSNTNTGTAQAGLPGLLTTSNADTPKVTLRPNNATRLATFDKGEVFLDEWVKTAVQDEHRRKMVENAGKNTSVQKEKIKKLYAPDRERTVNQLAALLPSFDLNGSITTLLDLQI